LQKSGRSAAGGDRAPVYAKRAAQRLPDARDGAASAARGHRRYRVEIQSDERNGLRRGFGTTGTASPFVPLSRRLGPGRVRASARELTQWQNSQARPTVPMPRSSMRGARYSGRGASSFISAVLRYFLLSSQKMVTTGASGPSFS